MSMGGKCNNLIHAFICIYVSFILVFNPKIEVSSTYSPNIGSGNSSGPECDGRRKSERIIQKPLKYIYLQPGNQANLAWTWCIAVNSSVTGIIIFRSSRRNPKQISPVLTMDMSKKVYYQKDKSRHELSSILNKQKFQEKTVFIISNVSEADSDTYILSVRREGAPDLQSEVQVIVKKTGLECDGTRNSERIITKPLKCNYLLPGNQANLVWTWCVAVNSSVTGIVISRSSRRNPEQISPVLTMDLSKNVYYQKDQSRHELISILNKKKFHEKTVFVINNVSKTDSAVYILCVRREGSRDLQSEVQVIVNTTDSTNELGFTSPITERTTASSNDTILERSMVHSKSWHLILGIVLPTAFVVVLAMFLVIKRKKSGDETREALFNETE